MIACIAVARPRGTRGLFGKGEKHAKIQSPHALSCASLRTFSSQRGCVRAIPRLHTPCLLRVERISAVARVCRTPEVVVLPSLSPSLPSTQPYRRHVYAQEDAHCDLLGACCFGRAGLLACASGRLAVSRACLLCLRWEALMSFPCHRLLHIAPRAPSAPPRSTSSRRVLSPARRTRRWRRTTFCR